MWTPSSPTSAASGLSGRGAPRQAFRHAPLSWVSGAAAIRGLLAALVDLVLPETAVPGATRQGCCSAAAAGRGWWEPARPGRRRLPTGLPPPWAVADYAGLARAAVLAHKEEGRRALGAGAALATLRWRRRSRAASSASGTITGAGPAGPGAVEAGGRPIAWSRPTRAGPTRGGGAAAP